MKHDFTIVTSRLKCEPLSLKHATDEYVKWLNDESVIKYLETEKGYTLKDLKNYLRTIEENNIYAWAIIKRDSKKHIGNIKIDPINFKHGYGEYGIMMGDKNSWGEGYAKEASEGIIQYCFEKLKLRKVNLGVLKSNSRALKLYESLGFVTEGLYKEHKIHEGVFCDEVRMALFI